MIELILGLTIEFSIRTVFLALALWVMVKFQSLEWNFLGLVGSAALGSGLDMIPIAGHYLAVVALWLCLKQATNGDLFPDIAFTVAVGYALVFCMNLFVLGALMGDLKYSNKKTALATTAKEAGSTEEPKPKPELEKPSEVKQPTPAVVVKAPDPLPPPQQTSPPVAKSVREIVRNFSVQGIIEGIEKPVGTIHSGLKNYSIVAGETRSMETKDGRIVVRFDGVHNHQAVLTISGEQFALSY